MNLQVHADAIETMARRYGFRTVFVASDDAAVPGRLRSLLQERGLPQERLKLVTVGEGRGAMGDRSQTSSEFEEHGVPAAKWIEHRLQQGELPKRQMAMQVLLDLLLLAERERERERETETETERDRDRETETERQRDRETERQRDRETERQRARPTAAARRDALAPETPALP